MDEPNDNICSRREFDAAVARLQQQHDACPAALLPSPPSVSATTRRALTAAVFHFGIVLVLVAVGTATAEPPTLATREHHGLSISPWLLPFVWVLARLSGDDLHIVGALLVTLGGIIASSLLYGYTYAFLVQFISRLLHCTKAA